MSQEQVNVEILKKAFEVWDDSKGSDIDHWLGIVADDLDFRSLAEGGAGLEFTRRSCSKDDFIGYINGLVGQMDMLHYTVDEYIAQGDRVVAVGRTAWRNKATGKEFDTPKVDVVRFRDGQIVEFFELYDTAMVLATTGPGLEGMIRQSYEARRRENVEDVLTYFDPQATFRIVANSDLGELGRQLQGHDELRAAFAELFRTWDWRDFPVKQMIIEGDKVVVHSGGVMHHTPSKKDVNFETVDILTLKDGKIVDFVEFFDTHLLDKIVTGAA